jgi:hypothetical protein
LYVVSEEPLRKRSEHAHIFERRFPGNLEILFTALPPDHHFIVVANHYQIAVIFWGDPEAIY